MMKIGTFVMKLQAKGHPSVLIRKHHVPSCDLYLKTIFSGYTEKVSSIL